MLQEHDFMRRSLHTFLGIIKEIYKKIINFFYSICISVGLLQYGSNYFCKKTDKEGFELTEEKLPNNCCRSLLHVYGGNLQTFVSSEQTNFMANIQWVRILANCL